MKEGRKIGTTTMERRYLLLSTNTYLTHILHRKGFIAPSKEAECNIVDYDNKLCSIPLDKVPTFYIAISPHHTQMTFVHNVL